MTPPSIRKSLPVMNAPSVPYEEGSNGTDFVGCPSPPDRRVVEHSPIPLAARTRSARPWQEG